MYNKNLNINASNIYVQEIYFLAIKWQGFSDAENKETQKWL